MCSCKEGLPFGRKPEARLSKLSRELLLAIIALVSSGLLNMTLDSRTAAILLMTSTVSFEYPEVFHDVKLVRPLLKKKASRFSRNRVNWNSLIASCDINVGNPLFGSPPPA